MFRMRNQALRLNNKENESADQLNNHYSSNIIRGRKRQSAVEI